MKNTIITLFTLILFPVTAFANSDAEFDWKSLQHFSDADSQCLRQYATRRAIGSCPGFDPSASYLIGGPTGMNVKVRLDEEGKPFVDVPPIRLIQSRQYGQKYFTELQFSDYSKLIPSEGDDGAFYTITYAVHFEVIDNDDPLYDPLSNEAPVAVVVDAIKARAKSLDAIMFGDVVADWQPNIPKNYLSVSKAKRVQEAQLEESKVKLFGAQLYGTSRSQMNAAIGDAGLQRIGSVPGKLSDVFDSSVKVSGSSQLILRYDVNNNLGTATYVFPNTRAYDVEKRISNVYGRSDGNRVWRVGRITIRVSEDSSKNGAKLEYVVMPYYKHLADDKIADMNAF